MKLIYLHQYFKTPDESGGTRSYEFARRLVRDGHEVIMITGGPRKEVANIQGIQVHYLAVPYKQQYGIYRRAFAFVQFVFLSSLLVLSIRKVDLVFATSTPLTIGIPALICKVLKKIPYVFEVRDPWPAVPIAMGALKGTLPKRLAYSLEKTIYRHAAAIVALSPGMKEGIERYKNIRVPVHMIPNASDIDIFHPQPINRDIERRYGLSNRLNVIHVGSLGRVNGIDWIIDAAAHGQQYKCIQYILLGEGSEKARIMARVKEMGLENVLFLPAIKKRELPQLLACCQVSLITRANIPVLAGHSANKLFDSLAAGLPCVVNCEGWTKQLIESNNCGFSIPFSQHHQLSERLYNLWKHPDIMEIYGNNARRLAENQFDREALYQQLQEILINTVI